MLKRIALLLMILQVLVACSPPGDATPTLVPTSVGPTSVGPTSVGPTSVGPTSVGPTSVGPTSVGPTSVGPTPVSSNPTGFQNVQDFFVQLPDGSTAIHFKGGVVKNPDGSTQTIEPFWISSAPITNEQYKTCVDSGGCTPPDQTANPTYFTLKAGAFPVVGLTFDQAQAYCTWDGGALPTYGQASQSGQGATVYLSYLFNAYSVGLIYMPEPQPDYQACDFTPDGCTDNGGDELKPCDLMPGGCTDGSSSDELKPCDLLPGGCESNPTEPSSEDGLKACDLKPGGCTNEEKSQQSDVTACELAGKTDCPPSNQESGVTACELAGRTDCPPSQQTGLDPLALQLIGLLSGPTVHLGFYSDDTPSGGKAYYSLPSGVVKPIGQNDTFANVSIKCTYKDPATFLAPYCQTSAYIAMSKDNYPPPVCSNVDVNPLGAYCSNKQPFVNVAVSNTADYFAVEPPPANCVPDPSNSTADTTRYICTGPQSNTITVIGQSQCSAPSNWNPDMTCLAGYTYDAAQNLCTYTGGDPASINCPTGFTYSAEQKCCVAGADYSPACAPGYYQSPLGCRAYASTYLSIEKDVPLPVCQGGNSSGGNSGSIGSSCNASCGPGEVLDIASCSCNPYKP